MSVLVNHFELGRHSVSRNWTWFHKFNHSHRGIGGGLWFDHFVHFLRMDQTCQRGAKLDNKVFLKAKYIYIHNRIYIYIYVYVHNSYQLYIIVYTYDYIGLSLKMGYPIAQIWWLIILFSFSNDWVIWLHLRTPLEAAGKRCSAVGLPNNGSWVGWT